jgi:hypothetical protein
MDSSITPFNAPDNEQLLAPKAAAKFLGLKESTLACWRARGPRQNTRLRWTRLGGLVKYSVGDLREFIANSKVGGSVS